MMRSLSSQQHLARLFLSSHTYNDANNQVRHLASTHGRLMPSDAIALQCVTLYVCDQRQRQARVGAYFAF
jgi:hypothetical protein